MKNKSLQILREHIYNSAHYVDAITSQSPDVDEYDVIAGYTVASLRRNLERELHDLPSVNHRIHAILKARIDALEARPTLSDRARFVLTEYRARLARSTPTESASLVSTSSSSSSPAPSAPPRPETPSRVTAPPTMAPSALFIFDRDHTLIDDNRALINPDPILSLLSNIERDPRMAWGIASAGSIGLHEDPGLSALRGAGYTGAAPLYSLVGRGRGALSNRLESIDFALSDTSGAQLDLDRLGILSLHLEAPANEQPNDGIYVTKHQHNSKQQVVTIIQHGRRFSFQTAFDLAEKDWQQPFLSALKDRVITTITDLETTRLNQAALMALMDETALKREDGQFTSSDRAHQFRYPLNGTATFQYGETRYTISLEALANQETFNLINLGDWKLFFILDLMDKAQVALSLENSPALQALGFTHLSAPEHYRLIPQENVVFTDDKPNCVALMQEAGFHAVLADTESGFQARAKEGTPAPAASERNAYLEKLETARHSISTTLAPIEQYALRYLKDAIHHAILSQKDVGKLGRYTEMTLRDASGNNHRLKAPTALKVMLDDIHTLERNPNAENTKALFARFSTMLTKKTEERFALARHFSSNTELYKNLLGDVKTCQHMLDRPSILEPAATPASAQR